MASVWFDNWGIHCPINRLLTVRDITREGFRMNACVADMLSNGTWLWLDSWFTKALELLQVLPPALVENRMDELLWRDQNGLFSKFSVRHAWEAVRPRGDEVLWYRIVWFSHCVPRHAFHLWLVMRRSLKTQDKMRQWDVGDSTDLNLLRCSLCGLVSCASFGWYAKRLPVWHDVIAWIQPVAHQRKAKSVIGRLLIAATSYFLWKERNNRLFKNEKRKEEDIRDAIITTVCLKLLTVRFKNTQQVNQLLCLWKMPKNFRLYGSDDHS